MNDLTAVTQVVLTERQARDRGWWDEMAACFHPDSTVKLSWIASTGPDFVEQSRRAFDSGARPMHHLSPPVARVNGDRAVAELSGAIHNRMHLHDVEVDFTSNIRGLYQLRRCDDAWLITAITAIYESDSVAPTIPGVAIPLDTALLQKFRPAYRFMGYQLSLRGVDVPDDLYGDDQPDRLNALYRNVFDWLDHDEST
jgi:SnoaL-like domain